MLCYTQAFTKNFVKKSSFDRLYKALYQPTFTLFNPSDIIHRQYLHRMKLFFTHYSVLSRLKIAGILLLSIFCTHLASAQVTVTPNLTALQLAQTLTGAGVTVLNPVLTCPTGASGVFGHALSPLGIDTGIVMSSGQVATSGTTIGVNGTPPTSLFASTNNGGAGDPQLTALAGITTYDACKLEFDFVPAGDTVKFQYVFGSEEYDCPTCSSPYAGKNYNCSINDIFAFFISGPAITGSANIALVPGTTNVPVAISTINDSVGATSTNSCGTNTFGHGPYTQYYVKNYLNTASTITYDGFTTVLTALRPVIPCDTYHLKLAIADASDGIYDSGVFLKAGSLNSNAISIQPVGSGGLVAPTPYAVRNCAPGKFIFTRPTPLSTPLTIHYLIQGTAINGTDYTLIPDSVVILANTTTATRFIYALAPPVGVKQIVLKVLSPYSCNASATVIDSAKLTILDSIQVKIANSDTTFCIGGRDSLRLVRNAGDTILSYSWSPTTGLNNPNIKNPIATPTVTTTYTVTATLPGAGCPAAHDHITITVRQPPVINIGPDRTTCVGTPFTFNVAVSPQTQSYTYAWTPGTYLSAPNTLNPTFTATTAIPFTQYILTVDPGAAGCVGTDTVLVRVLPGDFTLLTQDTAICRGATVYVQGSGDTAFHYQWAPTANVANPFTLTTTITPDTSRTYTVTASYPGCPLISHSLHIDVQPNPIVDLGPDRAKCQWDTLDLHGGVQPDWYQHYSYVWAPDSNLNHNGTADVVFSGMQNAHLVLTVSTPAGCKDSDDINIIVHPGNFASVMPSADTNICPNDSVIIMASGGVSYVWSPATFLSGTTGANLVSHPVTDINYTGLVTDQYGCFDTLYVGIVVKPGAVIDLPDSVTIFPGDSYQMDPQGNCSYFSWFPPLGLSNAAISNPVAMPEVNTRYYVNATTESGCAATDSIVVMVNPETYLDMPNAFAPGSSENGTIHVVHRGVATINYFRIFNRWGAKVFETNDITQGWDGRYNGEPQPMGVYVYVVDATTPTGRHFYKQGNITLIR